MLSESHKLSKFIWQKKKMLWSQITVIKVDKVSYTPKFEKKKVWNVVKCPLADGTSIPSKKNVKFLIWHQFLLSFSLNPGIVYCIWWPDYCMRPNLWVTHNCIFYLYRTVYSSIISLMSTIVSFTSYFIALYLS